MAMLAMAEKRCIIGEGPIWNEKEGQLYFVNGFEKEICSWNPQSGTLTVRSVPVSVAAIAFDKANRMIVSRPDGVFVLNPDDTTEPLYDTERYQIKHANDMKVGPDGRIYVGTQSTGRLGLSDRSDGKLFSIDRDGNVKTLLTDLILSNGMDWSMDETRFYHTDSDTDTIREYEFDKENGEIRYTGRESAVPGVDGFTIDRQDRILATGWGYSCVHVIDTKTMKITGRIAIPTSAPASCAFMGKSMDILTVVTAAYDVDTVKDTGAGLTYLEQQQTGGRPPYLFG